MSQYDDCPDEYDPGFVPFVVDKALRLAIKHNATHIRFRKCRSQFMPVSVEETELPLEGGSEYHGFVIEYENANASLTNGSRDYGASMEVARISIRLWVQFVSRLKVLANITDYGPNPMAGGSIEMDVDDGVIATFVLVNNPSPFQDSEVVLRVGDVHGI